MEYIVTAFRTRAHTVKYAEILRKSGTYCQIINTPKEAGVGCGLSVRISVSDFPAARRVLTLTSFTSFAGFFMVKTVGGRRVVRSI